MAENVWERGGVVSSVCHGGAIFPGIKDAQTGRSIIAGKEVTGFSTEGDRLVGVLDRIHGDGVKTTEESAGVAGGRDVAPPSPFDAFSITSGRVVTGGNPPAPILQSLLLSKPSKNWTKYNQWGLQIGDPCRNQIKAKKYVHNHIHPAETRRRLRHGVNRNEKSVLQHI